MIRILLGLLILLGTVSPAFAASLSQQYSAAYDFAYSSGGLNMGSSDAREFAVGMIQKRGNLGTGSLTQQYQRAYDFAYSSGGLNMGSSDAKAFAIKMITHLGNL